MQGIKIDISQIAVPGIYFLLQNKKIVYIGKSDSGVASRIKTHMKQGEKKFDGAFYKPVSDKYLAYIDYIEQSYILKHDPIFNRSKPRALAPLKEEIIRKFENNEVFVAEDFIVNKKEYERIELKRKEKRAAAAARSKEQRGKSTQNLLEQFCSLVPFLPHIAIDNALNDDFYKCGKDDVRGRYDRQGGATLRGMLSCDTALERLVVLFRAFDKQHDLNLDFHVRGDGFAYRPERDFSFIPKLPFNLYEVWHPNARHCFPDTERGKYIGPRWSLDDKESRESVLNIFEATIKAMHSSYTVSYWE